jgi:hypothetical protein
MVVLFEARETSYLVPYCGTNSCPEGIRRDPQKTEPPNIVAVILPAATTRSRDKNVLRTLGMLLLYWPFLASGEDRILKQLCRGAQQKRTAR